MTKYDEIMKEINLTPEARDRIIDNICLEMESGAKAAPRRKSNAWKYLTTAACCVLVIFGALAASKAGLISDIMKGSDSSEMQVVEDQAEDKLYENDEAVLAEEPAEAGSAAGSYAEEPEAGAVDGADAPVTDQKSQAAGNSSKELDIDGVTGKSLDAAGAIMAFESLEDLSEYVGFDVDPGAFEEYCLEQGLTEVEHTALEDGVAEISYTDGKIVNFYRMGAGEEGLNVDDSEYSLFVCFDGAERSGSLSGKKNKYMLAEWVSAEGFSYAAFAEKGMKDDDWYRIINSSTEEGDKR